MDSTDPGPSQDDPGHNTPQAQTLTDADLILPSGKSTDAPTGDRSTTPDERPPPLPPRPNTLTLLDEGGASPRIPRQPAQPTLQSRATTAVSLTDIASQDAGKDSLSVRNLPGALKAKASLSHLASPRGSEAGDTASIRSSIPQGDLGDVENVFDDFLATESGLVQQHNTGLLQFPEFQADDVEDDFAGEFEPVGDVGEEGEHEGMYDLRNIAITIANPPFSPRAGSRQLEG